MSYRPLWRFVKILIAGENGEMRDEKNDWRDGLRNAIYILLISLVSPSFFRVFSKFDNKCIAGLSFLFLKVLISPSPTFITDLTFP